jgi:signal transduction histidine kinase
MSEPVRTDRRSVLAAVLFGFAVAEVVTMVVAHVLTGASWVKGDNDLMVSNSINGLGFALAGWPVATYRPRNPIGWLFLAGGCIYAFSAAGYALLEHATSADAGNPFWQILAMLTDAAWAPTLTFVLPVALLLVPDGRLISRRWRWLVWVSLLTTAVFVVAGLASVPEPAHRNGINGYFGHRFMTVVDALYGVNAIGISITLLGALAAIVVRYHRAAPQLRRQLSWPMMALLIVLWCSIPSPLTNDTFLGVVNLVVVPISITIAILRRQMFDIQLVFSRSMLYLLLTAGIVGAYLALVTLFDLLLDTRKAFGPSVLATIVIAAGFNPVRVWLQRRVDRAVYGARRDPVRALAEVGARLGDVATATGSGLDGVLEALCRVTHYPSASITFRGTEIACYGEPPSTLHATPLEHGDDRLGDLIVGLRSGESRLSPTDTRVLDLLAAPIAVAVRANMLAEDLRDSRERVISGREEERRRLRRDLHDGLGPILTGVVLNAEAALRLVDNDPRRSAELLAALRDQTTAALADIRRVVYELRPPALDSLGLVGALHEYAMVLSRRADGEPLEIAVDAPEPLAELPAAVEVAAYRIATEALTNVTRHSSASSAVVRLRVFGGALHVSVHDDGVNVSGGWQPGVGLTSIRERAAELGGSCTITHDRTGGRVDVRLPLAQVRSRTKETAVAGS